MVVMSCEDEEHFMMVEMPTWEEIFPYIRKMCSHEEDVDRFRECQTSTMRSSMPWRCGWSRKTYAAFAERCRSADLFLHDESIVRYMVSVQF